MPVRTILASGGAEDEGQKQRFLEAVVARSRRNSGKESPVVCLLAQASGENTGKAQEWQKRIEAAGGSFSNLLTFWSGEPFDKLVAEADAFFVPGGNTRNLLLIWRDRGLDVLLRQAYEQGKVMAGYSAGGMCWFEETWTHLNPGELGRLACLGWVNGSFRPHYSQRADLAAEYASAVKRGDIAAGYGLDDGVIAEMENEQLARMSRFVPGAKAWHVTSATNSELSVEDL